MSTAYLHACAATAMRVYYIQRWPVVLSKATCLLSYYGRLFRGSLCALHTRRIYAFLHIYLTLPGITVRIVILLHISPMNVSDGFVWPHEISCEMWPAHTRFCTILYGHTNLSNTPYALPSWHFYTPSWPATTTSGHNAFAYVMSFR